MVNATLKLAAFLKKARNSGFARRRLASRIKAHGPSLHNRNKEVEKQSSGETNRESGHHLMHR
jgi:hypothetical protein